MHGLEKCEQLELSLFVNTYTVYKHTLVNGEYVKCA